MKFRKILIICLLFGIFLSISSLAAGDVNDTVLMNGDSEVIEIQTDEILKESSKTFTDLNTTINDNNDTDIYIDSNYSYKSRDVDLKNGIRLNRDVTIHGNGYTIDGNNAARIFYCSASKIVFKDLIFINAKSTDSGGGAIMGFCEIINSTFINNYANSGGALNYGTAINCTFINNTAKNYGGAMYYGSATNCIFTGNEAKSAGGAVYGTLCENCTFINNNASVRGGAIFSSRYVVNCNFTGNSANEGGAIYSSTPINCIFTNNTAKYSGGAIYEAGATNCTFINNSAYNNDVGGVGGAIHGGTFAPNGYNIYNCIFINNSAGEGGATHKIIAENCSFTDNYASQNGGAMTEGIAIKCNFTANHADNEGGATYDISMDKCIFENNTAKNGGAMSRGIAVSCVFINNTATEYGNAVYDAEISDDCVFNESDIYDTTIFEKGDQLTFKDLDDLINNNNASEIYLNNDYIYSSIYDHSFAYGIVISRPVTIYGNGHTIDGANSALIFSSGFENTTFKDIIFINAIGKINQGAAIKGLCTAINCTFKDNTATIAGGAMYMGNAINCTFISNSASQGGAMSGDGYSTYALNCIFILNSAKSVGGAIYQVSAINCTFINNTASYSGGAISMGSAVNSTFILNSARLGGATYGATATNCNFTSNVASDYGGAMYSGIANDCIFKTNYASIDGNDTYETEVNKPRIDVSNYSSTYLSGKKLSVNVVTSQGSLLDNVNITVRIYKNNNLIGTYSVLNGNGLDIDLKTGTYDAVISAESQDYEIDDVNITLSITKASTVLSASNVNTVYNGGKYLTITLKDSQKNTLSNLQISVNLNGVKKVKTDSKGQVKIKTDGLSPKTYKVKITFAGNGNYLASKKNVKVVVKKATPKLTAKAKTFKAKVKTKKYKVSLKTVKKAKLTLKVNGKKFTAKTNNKGKATFKITKLTKKSTFKATVKFGGNKYYNKVSKKVKIKVK